MDTSGLLLAVLVMVASIQDRDGGLRLLSLVREQFSAIAHVWAGGGCAGRWVFFARMALNLTVEVVRRTGDLAGFKVLPRRWVAERTLAWISRYRRGVRDYEARPEHREAMVHIAMIMTMSRRLARAGDWWTGAWWPLTYSDGLALSVSLPALCPPLVSGLDPGARRPAGTLMIIARLNPLLMRAFRHN